MMLLLSLFCAYWHSYDEIGGLPLWCMAFCLRYCSLGNELCKFLVAGF
jgi:hypothetical protein